MAVITTPQEDFCDVADEIAAHRGEAVTELSETPPDETVVYVAPLSEIREETVIELQDRARRTGGEGGFGLVTGYTAAHAADLYFRNRDADGEDVLLVQYETDRVSDATTSFGPDTVTFWGDDATVPNLKAASDDRMRSLSVYTHGWPIHLNLSEGYICGFPESQDVEAYPEPRPCCATDGTRNCPFDGPLLPAERIDAAHVFINSCGSMLDNGLSGLPVHVGAGLLTSVDTLIGSFGPGASHPFECVFNYCLLRDGYSLAERCYLLNENARQANIMNDPYVAFGNPDSAAGWRRETDWERVVETGESIHIDVTATGEYVLDIEITDLPGGWGDDRPFVRLEGMADGHTVYYTGLVTPMGLRVLVYDGTPWDDETYTLEVRRDSPAVRRLDEYNDVVSNGLANRDLSVLTGNHQAQLENLWNQVRSLTADVAPVRYCTNVSLDDDTVKQIAQGREQLREYLVSQCQRGEYFVNEYDMQSPYGAGYLSDASCGNCGRPVRIKQFNNSPRAVRSVGMCPRCGHVFDVPAELEETNPHCPQVTTDVFSDAVERTVSVEFTNPTEVDVSATYTCSLRHEGNTGADGDPVFSPTEADRRLSPGESETVEFTVDTNLIDDNQHYLYGRVVANLDVYSAVIPFVVGDSTGFIQPWHR